MTARGRLMWLFVQVAGIALGILAGVLFFRWVS